APLFFIHSHLPHSALHSFPTRRSSDLSPAVADFNSGACFAPGNPARVLGSKPTYWPARCKAMARFVKELFMLLEKSEESRLVIRSEEHTSELQSRGHLVCRLLLEKKKA